MRLPAGMVRVCGYRHTTRRGIAADRQGALVMSAKQAPKAGDRDRLNRFLDSVDELWELFFRGFLLGSLILFLLRAFVTG